MGDLDALVIGNFSLSEVGGSETRNKMRLRYKNHLVGLDFIKYLVQSKGNLEIGERLYTESNKSRFLARSLNSVYLLDYLTKNNIEVEVVSYFLLEQNKFKELMSSKPKVVAISTTFISDANDINTIAKAVREISPDSIIIVGGIKILKNFKTYTLYNKGYFNGFDVEQMKKNDFFFDPEIDKHIDIFVIEECGELTLLELIKKIQKGEDYKSTPNIAFYDKNRLFFTERVKEPYTFEQNLISWDKIPPDVLGQEIPVRAGIGCPYKCAFCDFTGLHSKVRIRTIDNLIKELKLIQDVFPGKPIFFTDDNLFTTKERTKQLCEAIVENGLRFKWRAFFRVDAISEDNVEALAKSGCISCLLGVESGDENILKNMNKRSTRDKILKTVNLLNENGINTLSTVIIGFPGETKESVDQTITLLNSYPDTRGTINQYYPFVFVYPPLAPIASPKNRRKYRLSGCQETWAHTTMNSEEARGHLLRCFKDVNVPTLIYPELMDPDIPFSKLNDLFKARENLVKSGINAIDEMNVSRIYETFKRILN